MALERAGSREHEQSQSAKKKDEERDEQVMGNAQLAYAQAEQQRARGAKEAEADVGRQHLAVTEKELTDLEARYEALGGDKEEVKRETRAEAKLEIDEAATDRAGAEAEELARQEEAAQQDREAKEVEARQEAERSEARDELVRAYEGHKDEVQGLIDLLEELLALEIDPKKRKKLQKEIRDELQPKMDDDDKKIAVI